VIMFSNEMLMEEYTGVPNVFCRQHENIVTTTNSIINKVKYLHRNMLLEKRIEGKITKLNCSISK